MRCQQRLRAFEVALGEIGLAKRALPEGALLRIAVLPGQNGRQGDLLVGEIIAGVLSHLLGRGGVVQRVIHDLERHAELHPVDPHRLDLRRRRAGDLDAGRRRGREQHRGLSPDHIEIIIDRRIRLAGDGHLFDLALGDPRGGGGKPSQHGDIAGLDHQFEGAGEQKIPHQNRSIIPPQRIRRILAAPQL